MVVGRRLITRNLNVGQGNDRASSVRESLSPRLLYLALIRTQLMLIDFRPVSAWMGTIYELWTNIDLLAHTKKYNKLRAHYVYSM